MIEFKADCGHVIQAEDRLAGQVVKCAYCGREVEAPSRDNEDSGLLFQEVDLNELAKGEGMVGSPAAMTIQGRQRKAKSAPSQEDVEQTGNTILRVGLMIGFGAVCLTVLVFVSFAVVDFARNPGGSRSQNPVAFRGTPLPLDSEPTHSIVDSSPRQPPAKESTRSDSSDAQATNRVPLPGRIGQSFSDNTQGVFIEAFSDSARVYVREQGLQNDDALGADESEFQGTGSTKVLLRPGQYRVAVTLDVTDPDLASLPGFLGVLDELAVGEDARAARTFLARDLSVHIVLIEDQQGVECLARYYDLEVGPNTWALATSLFVPGESLAALSSYLPSRTLYQFDDKYVERELIAYGVATEDLLVLSDLLSRAGQVVYRISNKLHRVFEIDLQDGSLLTRELVGSTDTQIVEDVQDEPQSPTSQTRGTPWGRRGGSLKKPVAADQGQTKSLQSVVEGLNEAAGGIGSSELKPYLSAGKQHAIWQEAGVAARVSFVALIRESLAKELLAEVGRTMLADPDLDVRLALLNALVRSGLLDAVTIIDDRLQAIEDDGKMDSDEAARENKELLTAKAKLGASSGKKKKGPWG